MTFEIARESRVIEWPHQDPADRFIVATARVLDLTLIPADERILRSRVCRTIANSGTETEFNPETSAQPPDS